MLRLCVTIPAYWADLLQIDAFAIYKGDLPYIDYDYRVVTSPVRHAYGSEWYGCFDLHSDFVCYTAQLSVYQDGKRVFSTPIKDLHDEERPYTILGVRETWVRTALDHGSTELERNKLLKEACEYIERAIPAVQKGDVSSLADFERALERVRKGMQT